MDINIYPEAQPAESLPDSPSSTRVQSWPLVLSMWNLHAFCAKAWIYSGCFGFLPRLKHVDVGMFISHCKMHLVCRLVVESWAS